MHIFFMALLKHPKIGYSNEFNAPTLLGVLPVSSHRI